ncbi:MAG: tyrosine-type recombinase/integrase [Clostridia bacterium]|nr:tyrosine-type recombinase/integrase [Clostridia bacterium]
MIHSLSTALYLTFPPFLFAFRFHELSHTFATRIFEKNQNARVVSELLGHSSTDITCRIYIHVIDRVKAEAMQTLEEPVRKKIGKRRYRLVS